MTDAQPPASPPPAPDPAAAAPAPAAEVAPPAVAAAASPAAAPGEEGVDKQLIGLAIGLWILAAVIVGMKWGRLRIDWQLGNLRATRDATNTDDPAAMAALVALATDDPGALRALQDEVLGERANRDPFFRASVVRTIARVPGPDALKALTTIASTDPVAVVRATAMDAVGERAAATPADRELAVSLALAALGNPGEPDVLARAHAAGVLGRLEVKEGVWPVLRALRDARTDGPAASERERLAAPAARAIDLAVLRALTGVTEAQLPFDPQADLATRDAGIRAWERWWVAAGHAVPDGEGVDQVYPASVAAPGSATPAAVDTKGAGGR